ncbi:MAG: Rieske 2Fe-2S domain-containing protein [Chloroflexota bacterium]|nr:Rieske 2Fe-2S domain-containing protein [Chloroflexota bacterium]MDE2969844.1 Rieske 2Fe-2S domain-containing protein [Chloroflexota bacterium]
MAFVPVDKLYSDVPPGSMRLAIVMGAFILLYNVDGVIYATSHLCPHAGAALNYGRLDGCEVECALHGAVFDVTTGEAIMGPSPDGLWVYPVKVEGDQVLVDLD